ATTVALEILKTVDSAIQAAQTVGEAAIKRRGAILKAQRGKGTAFEADRAVFLTLVETTSIKPGLYRLNKPWETGGDCTAVGSGLFAQLGLPTVVDLSLEDSSASP